jgi:hypothetical protein
LLEGLPDLVCHFASPQSLRDFWEAFNLDNLRQCTRHCSLQDTRRLLAARQYYL